MAAATPRGIDEQVPRVTWDDLPEEMFAKRMRRLRQMCVDTDDSCREQFFKVLGQVEEWQWEDMILMSGIIEPQDEHGSNRTEKDLKDFSLGESVPFQSPPPGAAAASSSPPAPCGPSWLPTPAHTAAETLEERIRVQEQPNAEVIAKNKADAIARRGAKRALEQQSNVNAAAERPPEVFPFC